jgi:hypothetical protein
VVSLPLTDDDGFDEADVLADALVFGLDDADALVRALGDAEPDVGTVDRAPFPGVGLVQVEFEVGRFPAVPAEPGLLLLLLGLGLGLGDDGGLVSVLLGLPVGLPPGVGLPLGLGEELGLVLALALLLALALDDVVALSVELLGGLVLVSVADEGTDVDGHALDEAGAAGPGWLLGEPSAVVGCGVRLWPPVAPALAEGLLLVKAWLMASPTCTITWRAGGTADSTTPIANTTTPTAKAGRSIASRQSLGRCGARRCGVRC